uniref:(northern house mosquito) hypothetical protein n=1 Tax=Culex pipiens TaxID=7175 RepID=A0A8D8KSH0_CULPI
MPSAWLPRYEPLLELAMRCRTRSKSWNRYWRNGSEFSWQRLRWRWLLLGGNGSSAPNRPDHYRPRRVATIFEQVKKACCHCHRWQQRRPQQLLRDLSVRTLGRQRAVPVPWVPVKTGSS